MDSKATENGLNGRYKKNKTKNLVIIGDYSNNKINNDAPRYCHVTMNHAKIDRMIGTQ